MRVGVFLRDLWPGRIGGMEVYVRRLLEHLPAADPELELVLFAGEHNAATLRAGARIGSCTEGAKPPASQGARPRHIGASVAGSVTPRGGMDLRPNAEVILAPALTAGGNGHAAPVPAGGRGELHVLPTQELHLLDAAAIGRHGLDLWWCPLLTLEPAAPGLPAVVTVPDLQHESHPEFFPPRILAWRREHYPRTVAGAAALLTLSEFSRGELVERLGADPERVVAAPLAAEPAFADVDAAAVEAVRRRHRLPERYLFYPANPWPHKNHRLLLDALADFRQRGAEPPTLVLTGAAEVDGAVDLEAEIARRGLGDRVRRLGRVPDAEMPALYAGAELLVHPSLFEGFGLPVVEAMAAGCAVLCARATSLPEVAGEAAELFDPANARDLALRLADLTLPGVGAERRRAALAAAGRERAAAFRWEETARRTAEAFRRVVREQGDQRPGRVGPPWPAADATANPAVPTARRPRGGRRYPAVDPGPLPPLTVVVPSYQQAEFLPRTLDSLLAQEYPHLQVVVIDGGSTDGSTEILERYRRRHPQTIEYVSEADRGQAHAVNKGVERARGELIGWLNSDDTYAPGALHAVARAFAADPELRLLYGRAEYVDVDDRPLGAYPTRPRFDMADLAEECYLCQPAVFWHRAVSDAGHRLREDLHYCLDYEWWMRLGRRYDFRFLDRHLANSRIYPATKTISGREDLFAETFVALGEHYGGVHPAWALGRAHHRFDGGDPFFDRRPISATAYLAAFASVLRRNWRRPRAIRRFLVGGEAPHWLAAAVAELRRPGRRRRMRERGLRALAAARRRDRGVAARAGALAAAALLAPGPLLATVAYPRLDRWTRGLARRALVALGAFTGHHPETRRQLAARRALYPDGWAARHAALAQRSADAADRLVLDLELPVEYLPCPVGLEIAVDGRPVAAPSLNGGGRHHSLVLSVDPPVAPGEHTVEITADAHFVPHRALGNGDRRPLAWRLERCELVASGDRSVGGRGAAGHAFPRNEPPPARPASREEESSIGACR